MFYLVHRSVCPAMHYFTVISVKQSLCCMLHFHLFSESYQSKCLFLNNWLLLRRSSLGHFSETLFVDLLNYILASQQSFYLLLLIADMSKTTDLFIITTCTLGLKMPLLF